MIEQRREGKERKTGGGEGGKPEGERERREREGRGSDDYEESM